MGSASLYFTYEFCGTGTFSPATAAGGCTDELACNYDAEATEDDGSCIYADTYYDCDGNCLNDSMVMAFVRIGNCRLHRCFCVQLQHGCHG